MTIAGLAEVQLGKLASERASSAEVKAFGQMIVKDHSQANEEPRYPATQPPSHPATGGRAPS
jgi:putative membrane protein